MLQIIKRGSAVGLRLCLQWRPYMCEWEYLKLGWFYLLLSLFILFSWVMFLLGWFGLGVRGYFCFEKRPRNLRYTNRRNKGLISVDRRTSLLSYLQYPVPYQSRLQRIYRSQCPKGD